MLVVRSVASSTSLSTPVTVTVCAVLQFAFVNVSAPLTVATDEEPVVGVTVTFPEGRVLRTTVYVAVRPEPLASVTVTAFSDTVTPGVSLSVVVTLTSVFERAVYFKSVPVGAPSSMLYVTVPSASLSSWPVTVTVCAVLQFEVVNVREDGDAVPSVVSLLATVIATSAVGSLPSFTVKLAVPPASVACPVTELVTTDAVSSSVSVTLTEPALNPA